MQRVSWIVLVVLHLLPIVPLFRPAMLTQLYGVEPAGVPALLLQHRAALFGAVAALCVLALLDPASRRAGAMAAAISMTSFLGLYVTNGAPPALRTIALADLIGLPFLLYVLWDAFAARAAQ